MNETDKQSFAKAILHESYDLSMIAPVDENAALAAVMTDMEELLELNKDDTRSGRFNYFNIPNTTVADYSERIFEFDSNRRILAGIRHVGGNRDLPFVNVTANFSLTNNREISEISALVKKEFKVFKPKHFAFWANHELSESNSITIPVRRYLAARLSALDLSITDTALKVELLTDDSYWQGYQAEYQKFHHTNPELKSWVTASEKDDLERYRLQSLLFKFYYKNQFAGLVGGEVSNLLGLKGLYMGELLIVEQFKGQGLACQMQKLFLQAVAKNFEVVWGTIDVRNIPSTKTALRVGRKPMRTEFFSAIN